MVNIYWALGCQALCYTKFLKLSSFNPLNSEIDTIILILQIKECGRGDVTQVESSRAGGQTQFYVVWWPNLFIITWSWGGTYCMYITRQRANICTSPRAEFLFLIYKPYCELSLCLPLFFFLHLSLLPSYSLQLVIFLSTDWEVYLS